MLSFSARIRRVVLILNGRLRDRRFQTWCNYWAVTLGSPWTFFTAGGFHLPVSASDFGP